MSQKKNSFSSSETSNHGDLRNSFYSLDVIFSLLPRHVRSLRDFSGTPWLCWIDQNVQWPTARCTRSIFKASKRRLDTFGDGNQTVRNEMLRTVLKINLKVSPHLNDPKLITSWWFFPTQLEKYAQVKLDHLLHKSGFQKVFKNHDPVLYDLKYRNKYCRYD